MIELIPMPSPNHEPRRGTGKVDMLVLHYTGMPDGASALQRLCDPAAKVSAHYVIEEDGRVFALVPESERAWHAGVSSWQGEEDVNSRSIGIELVNPGHEFGYRPFPEAQIRSLIALAQDILARHPIPPGNVVGHSDVAPMRKEDPGELFPWQRLADEGIGLWPFGCGDTCPPPPDHVAAAGLAHLGYDVTDLEAALRAFQRRYRPERIDGILDNVTAGRLRRLVSRV